MQSSLEIATEANWKHRYFRRLYDNVFGVAAEIVHLITCWRVSLHCLQLTTKRLESQFSTAHSELHKITNCIANDLSSSYLIPTLFYVIVDTNVIIVYNFWLRGEISHSSPRIMLHVDVSKMWIWIRPLLIYVWLAVYTSIERVSQVKLKNFNASKEPLTSSNKEEPRGYRNRLEILLEYKY